jgi:hypothetical protein
VTSSYGTEVEVCGITDIEDMDLNGLRGVLVKKWAFSNFDSRLTFGDIGIVIFENGSKIKANLRYGEYRILRTSR